MGNEPTFDVYGHGFPQLLIDAWEHREQEWHEALEKFKDELLLIDETQSGTVRCIDVVRRINAALAAKPADGQETSAPQCNGPFGDEELCSVHGEEIRRARGKVAPAKAGEAGTFDASDLDEILSGYDAGHVTRATVLLRLNEMLRIRAYAAGKAAQENKL